MRRAKSCRSSFNADASRGSCSAESASSLGLTQMESTGVLTASGSPYRSVTVPRCAVICTTREKRASPSFARKV